MIRELFSVYEQSQWVQSSARIQSRYLLWKFSIQWINNDGSDFYSLYWEQCVHFPFESIIDFLFCVLCQLLYFLRCMQNPWWCRFCFFIYRHNILFFIQYCMVTLDHNIQQHFVLDIRMTIAKVYLSLLGIVFCFLPHRLFIFNRRSCNNFVFYIKSHVLR